MGRKSRLKKERKKEQKKPIAEKGIWETWKEDSLALPVGALFYTGLIYFVRLFLFNS